MGPSRDDSQTVSVIERFIFEILYLVKSREFLNYIRQHYLSLLTQRLHVSTHQSVIFTQQTKSLVLCARWDPSRFTLEKHIKSVLKLSPCSKCKLFLFG